MSYDQFQVLGMRKTPPPGALVVNTCSDNDKSKIGDDLRWSWANPTNVCFPVWCYFPNSENLQAISTEAIWQGLKVFPGDEVGVLSERSKGILTGRIDWRQVKGKRPLGHFGGTNCDLITSPGVARRLLYIPSYKHQVERLVETHPEIGDRIKAAKDYPVVCLRDFDTGCGLDINRPMSHAWVLSVWLNTGKWPE